ncbi:MAG: hypothetical protein ABI665_11070 [Vicinamibacterales bacterium]
MIWLRAGSTNQAVTESIIAHHTTAEQAGQLFARIKPRLAVYSHAPGSEAALAQTRKNYAGPLQGAEDARDRWVRRQRSSGDQAPRKPARVARVRLQQQE